MTRLNRDILYELASVGDLPLPQHSPPTTNKRERDADSPNSSTPSDTPQSQTENMPRNIAGSRRVKKEIGDRAALMRQTLSASDSQGSSSSISSRNPETHPLQHLSTHDVTSSQPLPVPVQYYTLPVYSNELGRLPLHGQVAFSSDASVQHGSQAAPTTYWVSPPAISPTNMASSSGGGMRVNPGGAAPGLGDPGGPGFGAMSSMTTGFQMDPATMAAGMMFDTLAGTLSYGQHHQPREHAQVMSTSPGMSYGLAGMEGGMGGGMDGYRGLAMDTSGLSVLRTDVGASGTQGGSGGPHRRASLPGHGQQLDHTYQYVDNDTIAMWSTAPTGFECVLFATMLLGHLSNESRLTL